MALMNLKQACLELYSCHQPRLRSSPVVPEECVALGLQCSPIKAGHLGVVSVPVVVASARLRVLITCTDTSLLECPGKACSQLAFHP